jgi:HEAT repeat protein
MPTVDQSVQQWIDELDNPRSVKRREAAERLGRFVRAGSSQPDAIVPVFIRGLRDGDRAVRWWSAFGLGACKGSEEAVAALVSALNDPDRGVRDAAAFSLQFFLGHAESAVPALLRALLDADPGVRESAGMALLAIGPTNRPEMAPLLAALAQNAENIPALAREMIAKLPPDA